jgi:hypothetical protein
MDIDVAILASTRRGGKTFRQATFRPSRADGVVEVRSRTPAAGLVLEVGLRARTCRTAFGAGTRMRPRAAYYQGPDGAGLREPAAYQSTRRVANMIAARMRKRPTDPMRRA